MARTLYHYTSPDGLLGIVAGQSIHATNYSYLNDSSEMGYGLGIVDACIKRRIVRDAALRGLLSKVRDVIATVSPLSETYVACFTTRRDDLSQWRGYGAANVDRYCVGFAHRHLSLTPESSGNDIIALFQPYLRQVICSANRQRMEVETRLDYMIEHPPRKPKSTSRLAAVAFAHELHIALALINLALTLKNPAFKAESEWRWVITGVDRAGASVHFAVRSGGVRPYLKLKPVNPIRELPIVEVIVLPHRDPPQAIKATQMLLAQKHYPEDIVKLSRVPFVG
jgi:hypothetical protein